ncbi:YdcF family protein [Candidatus Liberibacter sp.]|uniref:YdcF family protein n=1 Tax=Candidatus Liberibacter sp. TaxID=34022 RepID=UPI00287012B3|nr:YdcF family protein [Candidatus Liberibacter sp.]
MFFIGCGLIPSVLVGNLQSPYTVRMVPIWKGNKNVIVLLGAGTTVVRYFPKMIVDPSPQSYSRIFETVRLYDACKKAGENHCTIVISGGDPQKHGVPESIVYSRKLIEIGINPDDIKLERKSLNTLQNAKLTSPIINTIIEKQNNRNIILVSSAYHLRRSQLYFKYSKIKTIASPADYITVHFTIIPSAVNFYLTDLALKEYMGIFLHIIKLRWFA